MAVKIRLSRIGKKKAPCYRIVAVDSRKKRDGAYLDNLGTYDALKGTLINIKQERIEYWVDNGATTTDSVKKIIKKHKKASEGGNKPVEKKAKKPKAEPKAELKVEPKA